MVSTVNIALLGTGTVGGGVVDLIARHSDNVAQRTGIKLSIGKIVARNTSRAAQRTANVAPVTSEWREAVTDPGCAVVVELLGGESVARECALAAAQAGKPFVTANKALLATHGAELIEVAAEKGTGMYFEAAVAGCVPVIRLLRESLVSDHVTRVRGIVNGTCNFILSQMSETGANFDEALALAHKLGYAEADPSLDIDGWDSAHKAVIMSWLAFGTPLSMANTPVKGIKDLGKIDEEHAKSLGYKIKLVATAAREGDGVALGVGPELIDCEHILAKVSGCMNAISTEADAAGEITLIGAGAGAGPTATAVVSDIIAAAQELLRGRAPQLPPTNCARVLDPVNRSCPAYMRVKVLDKQGVLAKVAGTLADAGLSIEALHQGEALTGESVDLVVQLHESRWGALEDGIACLGELPDIQEPPVLLPIAIPRRAVQV